MWKPCERGRERKKRRKIQQKEGGTRLGGTDKVEEIEGRKAKN